MPKSAEEYSREDYAAWLEAREIERELLDERPEDNEPEVRPMPKRRGFGAYTVRVQFDGVAYDYDIDTTSDHNACAIARAKAEQRFGVKIWSHEVKVIAYVKRSVRLDD